jgi:hypothetical protein
MRLLLLRLLLLLPLLLHLPWREKTACALVGTGAAKGPVGIAWMIGLLEVATGFLGVSPRVLRL